jgi:hypothetical protein
VNTDEAHANRPLIVEAVDLDDAGRELVLAIDGKGEQTVWLMQPGGDDGEPGCVHCAPHERTGRLPREWRERLDMFCAATTQSGKRCRVGVAHPGELCRHHSESSKRRVGKDTLW